eukprot:7710641-Karenia_brevis.AAC.1
MVTAQDVIYFSTSRGWAPKKNNSHGFTMPTRVALQDAITTAPGVAFKTGVQGSRCHQGSLLRM